MIFVGYLLVVGRAPDVQRVFQYHGAEHKTIHALEAGDPLTTEAVRKYPTAHPRCGTEFLVIVLALSIIAFSLVGRQSVPVSIATRIVLIPVIAAVGYELLRFGGRHRSNPIIKVVMYPGILIQMITTKQPTDDMIEVAIVSMEQALLADGETLPAGSAAFEREPLPPTAAAGVRRMSDASLLAKVEAVARQYDELQAEASLPETSTDPAAIRRLGKELSRLEPVVSAYRELTETTDELAGAREMRDARPTRRSGRWPATRSPSSRSASPSSSPCSRSCSCRATRPTRRT